MNKNTKIGVAGFGTIGSSMSALLSGNGYSVIAFEQADRVEAAKQGFRSIFTVLEGRGLVTSAQTAKCESLVTVTSDYADFAECEVVFECLFEDMDIKRTCYGQLDKHCPSLKALASTTSAMSPEDLKECIPNGKERVMVAHPFNPPHIVPFVELVKSSTTNSAAAQMVYDLLEDCGRKVCVMEKCAPGFIANRLQHALLREAMYMVEQGMSSPRDIDKALKYSFMPRYTSVGLFEHQDGFGMDMVKNVQNYMLPHLCDSKGAMKMVTDCIEAGSIGQRTGQGIYPWPQEEIDRFRRDAAEPYWKYFNWKLPKAD